MTDRKIKGGRFGSVEAVKRSLKKGSNTFIKQIPSNDAIVVRFIEEPEEWFGYYEKYSEEARAYYPLLEGETVGPDERRPSFRYLANVVDVAEDRVIPLKLPKDLANRLIARYEKYGTITDRDYELSRSGEGLETMYDCTPEPPKKRTLSKYEPLDLAKILEDAYDYVFGNKGDDSADDSSDESTPSNKRSARRR